MALLKDLIQQIDDPALREQIIRETDRLLKQKKFGLVFGEHLPECAPLYDIPVYKTDKLPDMLIFPANKMAVLIEETCYPEFDKQMAQH